MTEETANELDAQIEAAVNEPEVTAEQPETTQEESAPQESVGFQKRINKITADKHSLLRTNQALQAENDELKKVAKPSEPPKEADFDYDTSSDEYQDARINHLVDVKLGEKENQNQADANKLQQDKMVRVFNEKETAYADSNPEYFNEIEGIGLALGGDLMGALLSAENGPQLAHHLARNPDVIDSLISKTFNQAVLQMGQLEASISVKPKPDITKTPDPITPTNGSGAVSTKEPSDMNIDEFMETFG